MKKVFSLLICLIIALSFVSCSDGDKKVVSGDTVEVQFSVNEDKSIKNNLVLNTTLPLGMKINLHIKAGKSNFEFKKTVAVKGGSGQNYIETGTLVDGSSAPVEGRYIMMIESKLPSEQPESVVKIIGEKGQKMTGSDVYVSEDQEQYIIKINNIVELKSGKFTMPY